MNEKLIEYLKKHLESGSDMEKVRQALVNAGHDIKIVEEHMNHILKYKKSRDYIKKHIDFGLDIGKARQNLLNAGYDIHIVEEQLRSALENDKNRRHKIKTLKLSIAAVILAIIISVAGFYFFSRLDNKKVPGFDDLRIQETKYQKDLDIFNETADKEILNRALINHDVKICDEIAGDSIKSICRKNVK